MRDVLGSRDAAGAERVGAHVERRLEQVVGLERLLHVEGGGHHVGVEQPHLGRALDRGRGGAACSRAVAVLLGRDRTVQAERRERRGLVVLDLGLVEARGARLLLEAVDQRRPGQAEDEGGHHDGDDAEHEVAQPLEPDVGQHQQPGQQRDDGEDRAAGQGGVDVGVAHAGHQAARRRGQRVAAQPEAGRLDQQPEPHQQRQLRLERRGQLATSPADPDGAVEVGGDQRDHQAGDHDRAEETDHELLERQVGDEVGDVAVEVGVALAPGLGVAPQQVGLPLGCRAAPEPDAEVARDDEDDPEAQALLDAQVARAPLVALRVGPERRSVPDQPRQRGRRRPVRRVRRTPRRAGSGSPGSCRRRRRTGPSGTTGRWCGC